MHYKNTARMVKTMICIVKEAKKVCVGHELTKVLPLYTYFYS
jgi:hypothetical protein